MKYILILEDDADLAAGMEMALMSDDFSFTICSTIKEAEEKFRQQTFDLLILDVNLPDGSGFELCRKIRKSSKVSIILLTARDMELDIVRGLECGADDYITKPFSTMVLRARIRALLRRTAPEQETDYAQGPFRFQFATMEFLKNGIPVDLSRTEQRILYLLVFHPGTSDGVGVAGRHGVCGGQCSFCRNPPPQG